MQAQSEFVRRFAGKYSYLRGIWAIPLLLVFLGPALAQDQSAPTGAVAEIEGKDISVDGGTSPRTVAGSAVAIFVSSGNSVIVHSGHARMHLFAGGEVEICGPAKFTILTSGNAITLALNFGRVKADLPASTNLNVFTPTIIGTPLDIGGATRDVTVGLSLDDSLCVLARNGAIQLEHQFTGEKLIVPQAGEFFLNGGRLLPVAGTPGSCECEADDVTPPTRATPPEEYATNATPLPIAAPSQPAPTPTVVPPIDPEPQPSIEYSVLANANESHPVLQPVKENHPAPPVTVPTYTAVLPPLTFMAGSPVPPPGPTQDMILLIRQAQVVPDYEFSGHVESPGFAEAMQTSLGEHARPPVAGASGESFATSEPRKKKHGFWARLKRVFVGEPESGG
jgi:hypothetical protein